MPAAGDDQIRASGVRLGEMTWMEVEEAVRNGTTTVILPTGSIEQHGPHLPLLTDTIIADAIAERLAVSLGALAAPSVFVGCSEHHMGFPGSATVAPPVFVDTVESFAICLARAGFQLIVIFSAHGGNVPHLEAARERFDLAVKQFGASAIVVGSTERFAECFTRVLSLADLRPVSLPHADAGETSALAAIRPDLVHFDRLEAGLCDPPDLHEVLTLGLRRITANGVLGDPTGANADVGEQILDALVYDLRDHIRDELAKRA
jgi:creatinine amidohydrolase